MFLPEATARNLVVFLVRIPFEKRLRGVVEELVEGKLLVDYGSQIGLLARVLPLLDSGVEAVPPRGYLIHEEITRRFTRVRDIALHVQGFLREEMHT